MTDFDMIAAAGWNFPETLWEGMSDYEKSFALMELTGLRTHDYYVNRLKVLGFTGMENVLDAACGMGQWALCLAELNKQVEGIDLIASRIAIAKAMAHHRQLNGAFRVGSIEKLPYANQCFDGAFCYGAYMFTDMPIVLAEFYRVLKPGGRVYLNANSLGWYAHLILDRGLKGKNPSIAWAALKMIGRTMIGHTRQVVVTESRMRRDLAKADFNVIACGAEGEVAIDGDVERPPSAYPAEFYGMRSLTEVVAERH